MLACWHYWPPATSADHIRKFVLLEYLELSNFIIICKICLRLTQDDFTVHSASGKLGGFQGAALPWLIGMCAYTMTPAHHEVLVVEDMAADARFNFM